MTLTETPPTTADTSVDPTLEHDTAVGGFAVVLGSGDHKTVGRLYIVTSLIALLITGVTGVLVGAERLNLGKTGDVISSSSFVQVFSLHAIGGVFLFLLPLLIGLALVVVPLQVGAPTIAFPRAAAAAFWTYLVSGALVLAAFMIDGGPGGGDADGVELFLVAFGVLVISHILATVCIVTTVMALRAPGMTLDRVPLFSWANLVGGVIWLLTLPVLVGVLVLLFVDHRYFLDFTGGEAGIYGRVAWVFAQPSVYLFAIPVLGLIGDVVPVFSGARNRRHGASMFAIGAFGALALGGWVQLGFTAEFTDAAPMPFTDTGAWLAVSILTLIPLLMLLGLWGDTLRGGKVVLGSPLIYGLAAGTVLLVAVAIGAVVPIDQLDLMGTTATTAQSHAVFAAVVLALFGGVTYWSTKILGRSMAEMPSRVIAAAVALGGVLLVVPDLIGGAFFDADDRSTLEALNAVSLVGGVIVVLGALGFIALLVTATMSKTEAVDDPWEGNTLEWATASPPVVGNFVATPTITSEAPLYDARHQEEKV